MKCLKLVRLVASHLRCISLPLFLVGISFLAMPPAYGQAGKATIQGTVADPSGAVVPNADITVTNTSTGLTLHATSADNGTYTVPLLPVGTYTMTFSHAGFETYKQENIILVADQVQSVNATLTVGQVTQTVEVSANAELLQTSSASLQQIVTQQAVVDLPLNGRNPASLVLLSPGMIDVLSTGAGVNQGNVANPNDTGASAGGGRQGSTYYMLDGSNSMDGENLLAAPFPNPDATQEFQVLQNNFQAQYGFSPGAVVSIVTKSGTNQWHGDGFWFGRRSSLDATNFFSHASDGLKRNQYGGSGGGPIKKDRAFIFGNYQRTQEHINTTGGSSVYPNNDELAGNFSGLLTGTMVNLCGSGGPADMNFDTGQLFQPSEANPFGVLTTCTSGASAGQQVYVKTPYPGNIIDPSTFDPVSLKIEAMLPKTDAVNGLVYLPPVPYTDTTQEFTIRQDTNLSDRQRLYGRFFYNDFTHPSSSANGNPSNASSSWDVQYINVSGGHTWTLTPTLVNNANVSVNRTLSESYAGLRTPSGQPFSLESLGADVVYPTGYAPDLDQFSTNGFWIGENTNTPMNRRNIEIGDSITWTKGKHMFVFGADVLHMNYQDSTNWQSSPRWNFDGEVTGMSDQGFSAITGNDRADYLLGQAHWFEQGGGEFTQNDITNWQEFAQDTIRLKPNFTLNLGVRWEPYLPATPYYERMASWVPGRQSSRYPGSPAGLVFPEDAGIPASTMWPTLGNIDPRVGIAWQPSFLKHTSIRAAGGVFAEPISNMSYHHVADVAPFSTVLDLNYSQIGLIPSSAPWTNFKSSYVSGSSPFPDPLPFANLAAAPPGNAPFVLPTTVSAVFPRNFTNPKVFSWNFSIQHEFSHDSVLTVAYVASEGQHMFNPIDVNAGVNYVRPNANFGQIIQTQAISTSSYNSLQLSFNKRMSHGLQFTSNFTYSHCLDNGSLGDTAFTGSLGDPYSVSWNRGNCDTDIPLNLTTNWIYQEPAFKNLGAVGSEILGSWELTGIWTAQSGRPFGIGGGCGGSDESGTLIGSDRADRTGQPLEVDKGSKNQWLQQYFNPAAFVCNLPGTFGDSGRNIMQGPGMNNFDLGIFKNIPIKERFRAQFRWEMFNAFNRVWFSGPNTGITSGPPPVGNFGQITGQQNSPRIMQVAVKFYW